ncbi:site-specific integrase [Mangrovicoccus ximenensis]|uniref:site-specific integrase n=1 Tax=Mangrovicoccus ximenensis TaxID=1911570 RepID=UPI000D35F6BF|nr:site-specific integrase [Mangrovicoccus ximenensis]
MTKKNLPKYVYADRGYIRFIRRDRGMSVMMKEEPGSIEFWDHYQRLLKGKEPLPTKRTFETLILSYYESDRYTKRKPRTKQDYRTYLEHIRKIWGHIDPQKIERHHIYKLHQANADHWRKANYLVQVLVNILDHAQDIGFLKKEHGNPARGVRLFKQESDGWEPWSDEVREEFERMASPRALLVYELSLGLGQRIADTLKIRWDHIDSGAYDFHQGKTDKPLWVPLTERLARFLDNVPRVGLTVVTGEHGRPAGYDAVSDDIRKIRAKMEHPEAGKCVLHGLRKNAAMELYLAGCDDEMVKSVTGHSGVQMLKKYGGRVRQMELAKRAQAKRDEWEKNKNRT